MFWPLFSMNPCQTGDQRVSEILTSEISMTVSERVWVVLEACRSGRRMETSRIEAQVPCFPSLVCNLTAAASVTLQLICCAKLFVKWQTFAVFRCEITQNCLLLSLIKLNGEWDHITSAADPNWDVPPLTFIQLQLTSDQRCEAKRMVILSF